MNTVIAHEGGWFASELSPSDWRVPLTDDVLAEIEVAARRDVRSTPRRELWSPALAELARTVRLRLGGPLGFVVLTGFPVESRPPHWIETAYLALGAHLGRAVSQSRRGDFIGYVQDRGADIGAHDQRGYESSAELPFHADRSDLIGLLCVRRAGSGGVSRLASAVALHNTLLVEAPDLLGALYRPLPVDRRGEEFPGERPWAALPVFASVGGKLVTRYVRRFVAASQRWPDAPRLGPDELAAMDRLDEILERSGMALEMELQPGDVQLIDNFRLLHSRTAFADGSGGGRLLLRLWLAHQDSPPLPEAFRFLYGSVEAGCYRGGVWPGAWPPDLGQPVRGPH